MDNDLAVLLERVKEGDDEAFDDLMVAVYQELRRAAQDLVGGESAELTLAATDIVHEAFLRLSKHQSGWDNRRHFFGSAASAMRRILIDHARRKAAGKRIPASEMVSVELAAEPFETPDVDLLALDQALDRLAEVNTRQAQVVEMRYFGGLSEPEIAAALGVARVTVSRDWSVARLRLRQMLR